MLQIGLYFCELCLSLGKGSEKGERHGQCSSEGTTEWAKEPKHGPAQPKLVPGLGALQGKHGDSPGRALGPTLGQRTLGKEAGHCPGLLPRSLRWLLSFAELRNIKGVSLGLNDRAKTHAREGLGVCAYGCKRLPHVQDGLLRAAFVLHRSQHQVTLGLRSFSH